MSTAADIFNSIINNDNIATVENISTALYNRSNLKLEDMKELVGKNLFKENADYREGLKDKTREDNMNTFSKQVNHKLKNYKHDFDGDANKADPDAARKFSKPISDNAFNDYKKRKKENTPKKWY